MDWSECLRDSSGRAQRVLLCVGGACSVWGGGHLHMGAVPTDSPTHKFWEAGGGAGPNKKKPAIAKVCAITGLGVLRGMLCLTSV